MAVTASGPAYNFDREQEVTSSGLIVLQEFLKQLTEASPIVFVDTFSLFFY